MYVCMCVCVYIYVCMCVCVCVYDGSRKWEREKRRQRGIAPIL